MCLIPFSTGGGVGSNSFVITFAFPALVLLSIFIAYNSGIKKGQNNYPRELKFVLFCGQMQVFSVLILSFLTQDILAAFARSIFHLFGFVIFAYVISNAVTQQNAAIAYDKVSQLFILSGFIMAGYFIVNFLLAVQQNSLDQVLLERENGGLMALPWGASNTIAACLMMPLCISVERLFNIVPIKKTILSTKNPSLLIDQINPVSRELEFLPKKKTINILLIVIALLIIAIIITQSRNVLITLVMGAILMGILTKNTKPILIFMILAGIIFWGVTNLYSQDLETIFSARVGDGAKDIEGFNGRTMIWDTSLLYFSTHPLQPLGYFGMLAQLGQTAHNVFMTTLIEQGFFGLGVYLLFLFNNFTFCLRKISSKYLSLATRKTMAIYLAAMISIFVQLQFEDSNLTAQNIIYHWVFLSLMYLASYRDAWFSQSPTNNQSAIVLQRQLFNN
jgi:O-Antigen ligase